MVGVAQAEGALIRGAGHADVVGQGHTRLEEVGHVVRVGLPRAGHTEVLIASVVVPAVPVAHGLTAQGRAPAAVQRVVRHVGTVRQGVCPRLARSTAVAVLVVGKDVDVVERHTAVHADADAPLAGSLVALAGLRRDDDGTIGGAGTVEGCCCRALQHGDALDVVRVEVLDGVSVVVSTHGTLLVATGVVGVVHRDTVHHEEGLVVTGDGACTTQEHFGGGTDGRSGRHLNTGNLTGQGAHHVFGLGIGKGVIAQLLNCIAQGLLLTAHTQRGHHDLVQGHTTLEGHIHGASGDFLADRVVSDEAVHQHIARGRVDLVHAIHVGDDSGVGAFDDHRHTGQGFARLGIRHLTGHTLGEGRGGHQTPGCRQQE